MRPSCVSGASRHSAPPAVAGVEWWRCASPNLGCISPKLHGSCRSIEKAKQQKKRWHITRFRRPPPGARRPADRRNIADRPRRGGRASPRPAEAAPRANACKACRRSTGSGPGSRRRRTRSARAARAPGAAHGHPADRRTEPTVRSALSFGKAGSNTTDGVAKRVFKRGLAKEAPTLGGPSVDSLLDDHFRRRFHKRSWTRPPGGPLTATGTSTFRFSTSSCTMLANCRATPTKARHFMSKVALPGPSCTTIGQ